MLRTALLASSLAVIALAGCSPRSPTNSSTVAPFGGGGGTSGETAGIGATADPAPSTDGDLDVTGLGGNCGDDDACPAGTTCVTYYGVAGPSGPAFKSCEIRCGGAKASAGDCPPGTACTTISDGPGAVCRPLDPP